MDWLLSLKDSGAKELESCSAIHRALNHFELADLSFNRAGSPGCSDGIFDGVDVAPQARGKFRKRRPLAKIKQAIDVRLRFSLQEQIHRLDPMGSGGKGRLSIDWFVDKPVLFEGLAGSPSQKQTCKCSSQWHGGFARIAMHPHRCMKPIEPLIDDASFAFEALVDKLSPELRDVATSFGHSLVKIGAKTIDCAGSWRLCPGWGMSPLQPTSNSLSLHAEAAGDILMGDASRFKRFGFLEVCLAAGHRCLSCRVGVGSEPARPSGLMRRAAIVLRARVKFRGGSLRGGGMTIDQSKKGIGKVAQKMPSVRDLNRVRRPPGGCHRHKQPPDPWLRSQPQDCRGASPPASQPADPGADRPLCFAPDQPGSSRSGAPGAKPSHRHPEHVEHTRLYPTRRTKSFDPVYPH